MMKRKEKSPFEILENLGKRTRLRFSEIANDTTVGDTLASKSLQHRISFKKAIDIIKSYQFLASESIYAYSKALNISQEELKSQLRKSKGSAKYLPDISEFNIGDVSEDRPGIKSMLVDLLKVYPEFRNLKVD